MSYSFEVRNAAGAIVIDAIRQRFGMPTTGIMVADSEGFAQASGGFSPFPLIRLDVNKGLGFIPIGPYANRHRFLNANGGDYSIAGNEIRSVGAMRPYNQIPATGGYGIEVRNEQGQTTFSSAAPIVSFRDAYSFRDVRSPMNLAISSDVTHVFFVSSWIFIQFNPSGGIINCPIILRNSPTNLYVRNAPLHNSGPPGDYFNSDASMHILTARIIT